MRWFVEISPLGAAEGQKQKWCIEAAGWQPALKEARAIRGEQGRLGGISIGPPAAGGPAGDPVSRRRYVIRSAPDGTPITHMNGVAVAAAEKAEPARSAPAAGEGSDDVDIPVDEDESASEADGDL